KEAMTTDVITLEAYSSFKNAVTKLQQHSNKRFQRLVPIMKNGQMLGVIPWQDIIEEALESPAHEEIDDLMLDHVYTAYPDQTLDEIADLMAQEKVGTLPV